MLQGARRGEHDAGKWHRLFAFHNLNSFSYVIGIFAFFVNVAFTRPALAQEARQKVLEIAQEKLESVEVTYRYGGSQQEAQDCSHFIAEVFTRAGLPFNYLTSTMMIELSAETLRKKHFLRPVNYLMGENFEPGDLILYRGHVAMIETVDQAQPSTGSVIHVTGGKHLRGPGLGLQRERRAAFFTFRGPLLRVLRHVAFGENSLRLTPSETLPKRLRRIEPRR